MLPPPGNVQREQELSHRVGCRRNCSWHSRRCAVLPAGRRDHHSSCGRARISHRVAGYIMKDSSFSAEPFAKFASRWDLLPGRVVIPGKPMAGQVQIRILQKAQRLVGPILTPCGYTRCWARPGLSFSPQRAHAPSHVVPATLFAREHALRGKFLRPDHAPR